jgi:hypothetical protein
MKKTRNGFDYGGFSGAVGTDKADYLSLVDPERNILNSREPFVAYGDIIQGEHCTFPPDRLE